MALASTASLLAPPWSLLEGDLPEHQQLRARTDADVEHEDAGHGVEEVEQVDAPPRVFHSGSRYHPYDKCSWPEHIPKHVQIKPTRRCRSRVRIFRIRIVIK